MVETHKIELAAPIIFRELPLGAWFRFTEPPFVGSARLDRVYHKGSERTFGDAPGMQLFEMTKETDFNQLVNPV